MIIFPQVLILLSVSTYFVNGQGRGPSSKGPYKRGHCVQDIETSLNCECPRGTRAYCRNNKFEVPKAQRSGSVDKLKPAADTPEAKAGEVAPAADAPPAEAPPAEAPPAEAPAARRRKRSAVHTTTVCKAPGELDQNMDPKNDIKIQCVKSFRTFERNRWSIPRKPYYTYKSGRSGGVAVSAPAESPAPAPAEPPAPAPANDEPPKAEAAPDAEAPPAAPAAKK